nr:hypothetical protein [Methanothrix sp.]
MKAAMAVLIVLGAASLSLLAADGIESEGLTITGSATPISGPMNMDAQGMEDKIADLQSGSVSNANQSNNKHSTFFSIGIDTVQSNGSTVDLSKLINLSSNDSINATAVNASDRIGSGKDSMYSSSQGGLGKSKIGSSMSLEGDFEVQRSSSY